MRLTYRHNPVVDGPAKLGGIPHDLGEHTFDFFPNKLLSAEAEAIEDATDWTFTEFGERFMSGSMKAYRAALWILLKRKFPTLKFRDLSFTPADVSVEYDAEEKAALREGVANNPELDEEQRANLLAILADDEGDESAAPKEEPTPENVD